MRDDPIALAREFQLANDGNELIALCQAYGREVADVWIMKQPPPWSEAEVDEFSGVVTKALLVVLRARLPDRKERRRLRDSLTMVQGVALVAALDRVKQHALTGFAGGRA